MILPFVKKVLSPPCRNERGYLLVMVLVTLLLLVVIGLSGTTTTTVELQIAGNDKVAKEAFFEADGGTEVAARLVEENLACRSTGFAPNPGDAQGRAILGGTVAVPSSSLSFWSNETAVNPSDTSRDIYYPAGYTGTIPHTNITVSGQTKYLQGSAIQMVSGYEGKGKGAAGGGSYIKYSLVSQRIGQDNSKSEVEVIWRHVVTPEPAIATCNY